MLYEKQKINDFYKLQKIREGLEYELMRVNSKMSELKEEIKGFGQSVQKNEYMQDQLNTFQKRNMVNNDKEAYRNANQMVRKLRQDQMKSRQKRDDQLKEMD